MVLKTFRVPPVRGVQLFCPSSNLSQPTPFSYSKVWAPSLEKKNMFAIMLKCTARYQLSAISYITGPSVQSVHLKSGIPDLVLAECLAIDDVFSMPGSASGW